MSQLDYAVVNENSGSVLDPQDHSDPSNLDLLALSIPVCPGCSSKPLFHVDLEGFVFWSDAKEFLGQLSSSRGEIRFSRTAFEDYSTG